METSKIILKHTSGTKANQVETFPLNSTTEIKIGRAEESNLKFSDSNESGVSRNHALISKGDILGQFFLEDLNSLNGVILNGKKITEKTELHVGDEIQLGHKGPKFTFDIDPRPTYQNATELMSSPAATIAINEQKQPSKAAIGAETLQRTIQVERKKSNKVLVNALVATICLLAILGFTFKDKIFKKETTIENRIIERTVEA